MLALWVPALVGCGGKVAATPASETAAEAVTVPSFNADSAYAYVARQTQFGPRVPGTAAHAACKDWLTAKLHAAGADTVFVQEGRQDDGRGKTVTVRNVFARFGGKKADRVLLLAHYDTRPWADEDPEASNRNTPIDGANDGASGVGVLLEVARVLGTQTAPVGVDILLTDCEDSGISGDDEGDGHEDTWCLGARYFAANLPYPAALPKGAVLLDMVGGRNAVFRQEYFSLQRAPQLTRTLWNAAAAAGAGSRFPATVGGAVNDDHLPLLDAGVPTVDIIEIGHPQTGSFNPTWHTLQDNMDNIDAATLDAVGRTLLQYIYTL